MFYSIGLKKINIFTINRGINLLLKNIKSKCKSRKKDYVNEVNIYVSNELTDINKVLMLKLLNNE
jgi:hypothetical protein